MPTNQMYWLLFACAFTGLAVAVIGGNVVWLMHCHRLNKTNWAWFHGPWLDGQWKGLNHREKRAIAAFTALALGSFTVVFWLGN